MQFRTEISVPALTNRLSRSKGILTIGSCFAEAIGQRLQNAKAHVLVNPFGTIFNPLSAHKLIRAAVKKDFAFLKDGLVQRQDCWFHYDFHSSFHHAQPEGLLQNLETQLLAVHNFLQHAEVLLLTWGTAFGYERADSGQLVANCHKLPQKLLNKRLLTLDEITQDTQQTLALLDHHFPNLQVILTVSPVRHLKDTLALNSVSKSLLRVAAHQALEFHPRTTYFPAYELLLDDLRDYRFYDADLLHPSAAAEDYIWEKFMHAYADTAFLSFTKRWQDVQRDLNHRPFNPSCEAHQKFLKQLLNRLQEISTEANVKNEIAAVKQQLLP